MNLYALLFPSEWCYETSTACPEKAGYLFIGIVTVFLCVYWSWFLQIRRRIE